MTDEKETVPLGFGMALASRPDALLAFMAMPAGQKQKWTEKAKHAKNKAHMHKVVEDIIASTPEIR